MTSGRMKLTAEKLWCEVGRTDFAEGSAICLRALESVRPNIWQRWGVRILWLGAGYALALYHNGLQS